MTRALVARGAHVPLRRAVQFEEPHAHFRADGWGITVHQHIVRSRVHGHVLDGLLQTRLSWATWRWLHTRDVAVFTAETALVVVGVSGIAAAALIAAWWLVGAGAK